MPTPRIQLHRHPWIDALALVVAIGASYALFHLTDYHPAHLPQRPDTTRFRAESAYALTRQLAQGFGARVTGTPNGERAAEWIKAQFDARGLVTSIQDFPIVLRGRHTVGQNVIAMSGGAPGGDSGAIVLLAHYDGQTTSSEAAGDNAAGVGTLIELSRVLEARGHRRPMVYVATDAKEWGSIGARYFLQAPERPRRIVAAVALDHVANGQAGRVTFAAVGQGAGYAPIWLRHAAEEAYDSVGANAVEEPRLAEWLERTIRLSTSDQGPLVSAGVPAINVEIEAKNEAYSEFLYHTPGDRLETLDIASFRIMGQGAERLVHTIDRSPTVTGPARYFEIEEGHMVPGISLILGAILVFLPLVWATWEAWRAATGEPAARAALRGEMARAALWWVTGLAGLGLLKLVAMTPLLPRYELYPATVRDPFVYQVRWAPIVLPLIGLAAITVGFTWLRHRLRLNHGDPIAGRAAALATLLLIATIAVIENPFAAGTLLILPAWLWPWVGPTGRPLGKAAGTAIVVVSWLPFLAIPLAVASYFEIGVKVGWYMVLQAAYGAWSPLPVVVFMVAVAASWRLIGTATASLAPVGAD